MTDQTITPEMEAAARALCLFYMPSNGERYSPKDYAAMTNVSWRGYVPAAKAVLATLLTPSEKMIDAACAGYQTPPGGGDMGDSIRAAFVAAIEETLSNP